MVGARLRGVVRCVDDGVDVEGKGVWERNGGDVAGVIRGVGLDTLLSTQLVTGHSDLGLFTFAPHSTLDSPQARAHYFFALINLLYARRPMRDCEQVAAKAPDVARTPHDHQVIIVARTPNHIAAGLCNAADGPSSSFLPSSPPHLRVALIIIQRPLLSFRNTNWSQRSTFKCRLRNSYPDAI